MKVLLVERINKANQYIEELAKAYQLAGHEVIFDVQNFLYSNLLPDVVHIHWPEAIYKWRHQLKGDDAKTLIEKRLAYYQENGVPIVYTAHNLLPHGSENNLDRDIYAMVAKYADVVIHHGNKSISLLKTHFDFKPEVRHLVAPHGPYIAEPVKAGEARKSFKLPGDRIIYLNFGRIRPNKGYDFTRSVFQKFTTELPFLFTIGPKSLSRKERIIAKVKDKLPRMNQEKNSLTLFREIKHEEISHIFSVADVVFLGHLDGLNSGVLAQAISHSKPVVFPDLGNFTEQAEHWEFKATYKPGDKASAIEAIKSMNMRISELKSSGTQPSNQEWLEKNDWSLYVKTVLDATSGL